MVGALVQNCVRDTTTSAPLNGERVLASKTTPRAAGLVMWCSSFKQPEHTNPSITAVKMWSMDFMVRSLPPNDPSSATAATRRADCNHDGPPPFAAAHG